MIKIKEGLLKKHGIVNPSAEAVANRPPAPPGQRVRQIERPWIELSEVCQSHFGVTYETALNKIAAGSFPVMTYKIGKKVVIDRIVLDRFFETHRALGLKALKSP